MKKKILVVDDENCVVEPATGILEGCMPGYQVEGILNFSAGLSLAQSPAIHDFAAVLLDGQINGHGGFEIAEALRANGYKGIIISVTGKFFTEAVPLDKRWCFNAYYHKPAHYHEIAGSLLDEWLRE